MIKINMWKSKDINDIEKEKRVSFHGDTLTPGEKRMILAVIPLSNPSQCMVKVNKTINGWGRDENLYTLICDNEENRLKIGSNQFVEFAEKISSHFVK